ncbi:MAG TPA: class II fructose-bisphosphate aldolase [Thermomicrobiales bacterium]|nr:class II fructose-bisphosphate aldolase [Thermomicrobiales bacterium]
MALVDGRAALAAARAGGYAIPAFNVFDLEMLQATLGAAVAERSPVVVQVSPRTVAYAGLGPIAALAESLADPLAIPVVLHLDHGPSLDACEAALDAGFTSVMFDGAELPFDENVVWTRKVVKCAHEANAAAEAELGRVGQAGAAAETTDFTDPAEAARFVAETGVEALAVSIGTIHGMRQTGAKVDLARIRALRDAVEAPLVMHGSSGVDDATLQAAIAAGITKVNLSTALQGVFMDALRASAVQPGHETDVRAVLGDARAAVEAAARRRIQVLGAAGKAG